MAIASTERETRRGWRAQWSALWQRAAQLAQPQVSTAARERRDMLVLLAAVGLVVAPHIDHLPWWANAVLALLFGWRTWLTITQRPLPGRGAMLPLLLSAGAAVYLEHGTLVGRDAGVTFLLLLMALKLLELRARRDVFVVIFLAFFILLTQFLYGQELHIAALTLGTVLLLFLVLVSVNLVERDLAAGAKLRLVALILLKSLPLTAALFVLFPRVEGPLWGLPGDSTAGSTGLSNSMSPGAISRLLESNEIAFRVRFDGAVPANRRLYWRGPVFGDFNGRTWSPLAQRIAAPPPFAAQADASTAVDYTVTLEPHQRDWLFALDLPAVVARGGEVRAHVTSEGQVLSAQLVTQRIRYGARSYTAYALGLNESALTLRDWLELPAGFNPRTLEFAQQLKQATPGTGNAAREQLIETVLDHFRRNGYRYTLAPPRLGRHSVDEFLFDTRQGYCEHYASAFVVLMRALDVPARVVTGYQGGEVNPVDGFMTVRQSDAHAWTEVWLAGRGWVRIDPTAVVAPLRIERGAPEIARQQGLAPLRIGARTIGLLQRLRFNWEAVQNAWNQWVISYSQERQRAFLESLGLDPDWRTLAWVFASVVMALLSALAYFSLRHRVQRDPLAELTARLREQLHRAGVPVTDYSGPRDMAQRLGSLLARDSEAKAREILLALERWRYSRDSQHVSGAQVRALRRTIARFRPRLAD
jgi:transglutaminase-like putative cysteine protease